MKNYGSGGYYDGFKLQLPNSTAVLVLGIVSILSCWCYGIIGLILSIIALILAAKDRQRYLIEPDVYTESSYKNLMAGRIVAIIGLCLSGLFFLFILFAVLSEFIDEIPWEGLT